MNNTSANIEQPRTAADENAAIGLAVKQLREARDISIAHLSNATGFTVGKIEAIEQGHQELSLQDAFATSKALRCNIGQIIRLAYAQLQKTSK